MKKNAKLLIGSHMSISKGLHLAIERGESIGCTCIQVFTKSNRRLFAPPLQKENIEAFRSSLKKSTIKIVIAHSGYLINVASPDKEKREQSTKSLSLELARCKELGIKKLVLHPGAGLGEKEEDCIKRVAESIDTAITKTNRSTKILLETVAGEGTKIGYKFEQLAKIIEASEQKKHVGVCFDTCHAFAAGYNFTTEKTYEAMWKLFDETIGLEKLEVFHVNDSKGTLGSRKDRHESIGDGKIGLDAFKFLMNDEKFKSVPKILETPKTNGLSEDLRNIAVLKNLTLKQK